MPPPEYGINKDRENALEKKLKQLNINEADIRERFIRSGGAGGQKVNKTSSCVYLKHLPTGIEVKCQKTRYQGLNRFFARRVLAEKIESLLLKGKSQEQKRIAKIRKQKRKRSKRAKEKILKIKKQRSQIKKMRAKVLPEEY